jgi:hypothetical protein
MTVKLGLFAQLEAKPGKGEELAVKCRANRVFEQPAAERKPSGCRTPAEVRGLPTGHPSSLRSAPVVASRPRRASPRAAFR